MSVAMPIPAGFFVLWKLSGMFYETVSHRMLQNGRHPAYGTSYSGLVFWRRIGIEAIGGGASLLRLLEHDLFGILSGDATVGISSGFDSSL